MEPSRTGQDGPGWLDTARRFRSYSFNNVLLIAGQHPDATAVAGLERLEGLDRQLDKGERGIQVLAPGRALADGCGAGPARPGR